MRLYPETLNSKNFFVLFIQSKKLIIRNSKKILSIYKIENAKFIFDFINIS